MKALLSHAEKAGAARDHKLVSTDELRSLIESAERDGKEREVFTDDILYINLRHRDLLERFAEFVRLVAD